MSDDQYQILQDAKWLEDEEIQQLMLLLLLGDSAGHGVTKEQMEELINWAKGVRLEGAMLEGVMGGHIRVTVEPDDEQGGKLDLRFHAASEEWQANVRDQLADLKRQQRSHPRGNQ